MNKFYKLLILGLVVLFSSNIIAQNYKIDKSKEAKHYFFIKLANGVGASVVRYGVIDVNFLGKKTLHYLSLENFMYEFTANRPSKANPDTIDFMREYSINYKTLKSLWKIKYSEFPWHQKYEKNNVGWAGKEQAPSAVQMIFLKQYGVEKFITEPIYGNNLIKLLQDMQNETWRTNYMNMR